MARVHYRIEEVMPRETEARGVWHGRRKLGMPVRDTMYRAPIQFSRDTPVRGLTGGRGGGWRI